MVKSKIILRKRHGFANITLSLKCNFYLLLQGSKRKVIPGFRGCIRMRLKEAPKLSQL